MKRIFDRIPLPAKLFLIGFIPLMVVIFLTVQLHFEKTRKANLLKSYIDLIHESADITDLIDLLRVERNHSYDHVLVKEKKFEISEHRARTDSIIGKLLISGNGLPDFRDYTFLSDLDSVRSRIDSNKITASQVMHYYTTIVFRLNTLNPIPIGAKIYLPELYDDLVSQKLLSEMVTYLGITSTNIYTALYTQSYMLEILVGTLGTYQVFNSYEKEFLARGAPSVISKYKELRDQAPLRSTLNYLANVFKDYKFDSSYNSGEWRIMSGNAVEKLRLLQQNVLKNAEVKINNFYKIEKSEKNNALVLLVLIVVILIAFVIYTVHIINQALFKLKNDAEKISAGGSGMHVSGTSDDVIGSLAMSILKIEENNKVLAKAADAIGQGNFDVAVHPRSKEDQLGKAIAKMKEGLQRFTDDLKETEKLNRQLLHLLPATIYTCDANGVIKMYNKSAIELWGVAPRPGSNLSEAGWNLFGTDGTVLEIDNNPMMRVLKGETFDEDEVVVVRDDGSKRYLTSHPQVIQDESGKITGAINMLIDITERKQIEKDIANLAAIVQFSEDAIISKSLDGIITSWNPGAEKLFGYSQAEMIGASILKLIPPDRAGEEPEILSRIRKGEQIQHFNTIRRTKSGRHIDISLTLSPIKDGRGNIIGVSKIARDVTETVRSRKKIEESEQRLRMAIASTNLGTWDYHPLTGELNWSEECKKIYAFPPGEKIDMQTFSDHIHPDDKEFAESEILKSMSAGGNGNYDIIYRILRFGDKSVRWIRAQGKVYFNSNREAERFIGTVVDITEQKEAHNALEESEQRTRLAIEAARMGSFDWNLITKEFTSSPRLHDIFGYSDQEDITHQRLIDAFHPDDRPQRDRAVKESAEKGSLSYEARIFWPDRSIHWIKVFGKVIYGDKQQPLRMYGTVVDVTEERNALFALKENEQRLNIAIQAAELGTWELNLKTREPHFSERYLEILGFEPGAKPSQEEIASKIHPDDLNVRKEGMKVALETGALDYEMRINPEPDTLRWIRARGKVFYDEKNEPFRMLGTIVDITEQVTAFNVLQESEERFKIIANTAPVMIWMSGPDKFSDFFNISWLNFTGRTLVEERGDGWLEGVHPADVEKCVALYEDSFKKQRAFTIEYRLRRHDGNYRWISDHAVPRTTPAGKFIGFISACRDIDDEKHYNEKLKESELLFKTISNVSPVGLWMTDKLGKNSFVNDTWIEWTGISKQNQFDRGWMDVVIDMDKEYINKRFEQCFNSRSNFSAEFRIRRKDEKIRWILSEGSPYFDIEGFFAGYAGSVTDITERKEDEMRKNEFLAVASHELKTPLTSIKAYAQLLAKTYAKTNDVFLNNALSKVEMQVNKMTKLVSDFLNLSKIESDKLQLSSENFSLNDLVKEIAADMQLVSVNHTIIVENGEVVTVQADREKISQVITNFLNNAVKYSPAEKDITITVVREEINAKVSVIDKGIGVNPEEHTKIFQRFYRSRFNDNISFSGFGIGLYISAEIIRRHNGQIGVVSNEGKGANFYFTLPSAKE